ncbi:hypothetical protein [Rossellomorea sp. NS-SX7]|uniref:hypothetical protein n=1 Tax=Rossellomorea sp. NS-SX7 TaxID=3463856 RepID=UPI004059EC52
MNGWENNTVNLSEAFDQDYGTSTDLALKDQTPSVIDYGSDGSFTGHGQDIYHYSDPLKYTNQFQFKPLHLGSGTDNIHFVEPHYVDPYIRKDGTLVEGYFRDGDGNSSIDTPLEQGGGYIRTNPDGNPFNNLKG